MAKKQSTSSAVRVQIVDDDEAKPQATKGTNDPILAALLNVTKTVQALAAKVEAMESNGAKATATEPEPEVKRGRGRPKGSTNKAKAEVTTTATKAAPKIKLTIGEAKALVNEHWRKAGETNKSARVSVRSAVSRALGKLGASDSDHLSDFVGTKVGEKSGKSQAHYVAEAITVLQSDLD